MKREHDRRIFLQALASALPVSQACTPPPGPVPCAAGPGAPPCPDGRGKHLSAQGSVVRSVARGFGLRHDETCMFRDGFTLYDRVVNLKHHEHANQKLNTLHGEAEQQTKLAMGQLASAIAGTPSDQLGSRHVRRLPERGGRYVVFSDHHYTFKGHRTNYFEEAGNLQVYVEALDEYRRAGFTVIENGDVEDLVIFDPTWYPDEIGVRKCMDLPELIERRLVTRRLQLERILKDPVNAPLIEAYRRLDESKQLIRVAGNHDYDNQRPEFFAMLQEVYPNLRLPSDIVLIDREDGSAAYAIMHGHQFDLATNPISAPRFGETISETLGLYYQGPDRIWRWRADDVHLWAQGAEPFLDNLALDRHALNTNIHDRWAGSDDPITYNVDLNPNEATSSIKSLFADYQGAFFEALFRQTISWHYFKSKDPIKAFTSEVLSGDRFFKYQLLDEVWIKRQILETFPDEKTRPTLVLGHTHEVRLNPFDTIEGKAFPWYLNSGSAGRFENLIWGIEIEDGKATLVSFSRSNPPFGKIERRVWRSTQSEGNGWVRASRETSNLTSLEEVPDPAPSKGEVVEETTKKPVSEVVGPRTVDTKPDQTLSPDTP